MPNPLVVVLFFLLALIFAIIVEEVSWRVERHTMRKHGWR